MKFRPIILFLCFIFIFSSCSKKTETTESTTPTASKPKFDMSKVKIGLVAQNDSTDPSELFAIDSMKKNYSQQLSVIKMDFDGGQAIGELYNSATTLIKSGNNALIISRGIEGTGHVIKKIRQDYPDTLFLVIDPEESPDSVVYESDIVIGSNISGMSNLLVSEAKKNGASQFVYFTNPTEQSNYAIKTELDAIKQECANQSLGFTTITSPDMSDCDLYNAHLRIIREIEAFTKSNNSDVAFYSPNILYQDAIINGCVKYNGIFPGQCYMSPYVGYIEGLEVEISYDKFTDVAYTLNRIKTRVAEQGREGRFSSWAIPCKSVFLNSCYDYASAYLSGEIESRNNPKLMTQFIEEHLGNTYTQNISSYKNSDGNMIDSYYLVLTELVNF